MGRTPCCEKEGLRRGRWTAEEDDKLKKYIEANGEGSWRSLPKNAGEIDFDFEFFVRLSAAIFSGCSTGDYDLFSELVLLLFLT